MRIACIDSTTVHFHACFTFTFGKKSVLKYSLGLLKQNSREWEGRLKAKRKTNLKGKTLAQAEVSSVVTLLVIYNHAQRYEIDDK